MAANWSEISEELVDLVAEQLVCVDDFIRFGVVCKPWRRAVSIVNKDQVFAPMIMLAKSENDNLPPTTSDDDDKGIRSFIIPHGGQGQGQGKQDKMRRLDIELSKAQGRRCWGSPYGWVVTIGLDYNIHLLNPLTGVQIPLPSQPNLQQQSDIPLPEDLTPDHTIRAFTRKFVVGWNPSSKGELMVMAIFGQAAEVAFTTTCILPGKGLKPSSWTRIESDLSFVEDIIFFKGKVFAIDRSGCLSVCRIDHTPPKAIQIASSPEEDLISNTERCYLVEIAGSLHLVVRNFGCFGPPGQDFQLKTECFLIYRFNFWKRKWYVVEEDLGEYALFVGSHTSFAISTITYPDFSSNCIYFSDDHFDGYLTSYCDMGVYDYDEGTIQHFDFKDHAAFSKFSRPIFFMPAL